MPYNISPESGGDNKENDAWMEKCVMRVMKTGKDKGSSVAICKAVLAKSKGNTKTASLLEDNLLNLLNEEK
jgi:hypothetical protein